MKNEYGLELVPPRNNIEVSPDFDLDDDEGIANYASHFTEQFYEFMDQRHIENLLQSPVQKYGREALIFLLDTEMSIARHVGKGLIDIFSRAGLVTTGIEIK